MGPCGRCDIATLQTISGIIKRVSEVKLLGVYIDLSLSWNKHINYIASKAGKQLYFLKILKRSGVSCDHLLHYYIAWTGTWTEIIHQYEASAVIGRQSNRRCTRRITNTPWPGTDWRSIADNRHQTRGHHSSALSPDNVHTFSADHIAQGLPRVCSHFVPLLV